MCEGVSLQAKKSSENTSENDLMNKFDWVFEFTSNQNFFEGFSNVFYEVIFSGRDTPFRPKLPGTLKATIAIENATFSLIWPWHSMEEIFRERLRDKVF